MGREGEGYEHPCLNDILILYAERGAGKGDREGGHHQFKWCIYWFLCHIKLRGRRGSEMGGGGREGKETGEEEGKWENRTSLPLPLVCEHEAIGTWEGEGKEEGALILPVEMKSLVELTYYQAHLALIISLMSMKMLVNTSHMQYHLRWYHIIYCRIPSCHRRCRWLTDEDSSP